MKKLVPLVLLLPVSLSSCKGSTPTSSSSSTPEVSTSSSVDTGITEHLIDAPLEDNYRNWYEIFPYSYCDSNNDKIGDLLGIDSKLGYLRGLGYTGIWLTPIFKTSTYHGYDINDYFQIRKDFGTMDDLKKLVKDAHALGIKVILDGVFNHTGLYNPWYASAVAAYKKKLAGTAMTEEEENYSSLYSFFPDKASADAAISSHEINRYSAAGANGFYYECNFDTEMPELNFDSEFTYGKIKSVIDYYMADDIGIDGFRLDATSYYYYGSTVKNVPVLTRIAKMIKDNNPNGYSVGECWESSGTISEYYKSGIDSFFYFPGSSTDSDSFLLRSFANPVYKTSYSSGEKKLLSVSGSHIPAPFLDNHDMGRATASKYISFSKFQLGLLAMTTGASFHYYGDEIGMSSSENSPKNDANYRTHYYWNDTTHEGECRDPSGATEQVEYYPSSADQEKDSSSILNYVKKANLIRNAIPGISRGEIQDSDDTDTQNLAVKGSSPLLAVNKSYNGSSLKIIFNFSGTETGTYDYSSTDYEVKTVLEDTAEKVINKNKVLTLPPYSIAVLGK
ncbi:MAG: alpha-amylase family glycosyl hydrolase [Bacilli bacterium]